MRFIQVGVGGFGRVWLQALANNRDARLTALVDVNPAALDIACETVGLRRDQGYASLADALARHDAEAVVCVTPPEHHRAVIVEALEAGLHVISEKPMAAGLADCRAILRAARKSGRLCAVSQNYRYRPPTWTLAKTVGKGTVGEIGQVRVDFYKGHDFGGGFRHEMDYPVLVDMAIHHFDLLRFITGLDAVAVRGTAWNPPWSNYRGDCSSSVVFEMSNGTRAVYNASWCAKGDYCSWDGDWLIEGSRGALTYRGDTITLNVAPDLYTVKRSRPVRARTMRRTGQAYVLAEFMKAVRNGSPFPTDVRDNIRSVAMVFAAVKAVRTGRRVPVLDTATAKLLE